MWLSGERATSERGSAAAVHHAAGGQRATAAGAEPAPAQRRRAAGQRDGGHTGETGPRLARSPHAHCCYQYISIASNICIDAYTHHKHRQIESQDIIVVDFSHPLLDLHAPFRMRMDH